MEWIKCDDRMSDDSQSVLFYAPKRNMIEGDYYDADQDVFIVGVTGVVGERKDCVSHWMPFPEPPEE